MEVERNIIVSTFNNWKVVETIFKGRLWSVDGNLVIVQIYDQRGMPKHTALVPLKDGLKIKKEVQNVDAAEEMEMGETGITRAGKGPRANENSGSETVNNSQSSNSHRELTPVAKTSRNNPVLGKFDHAMNSAWKNQ
ncbi:hypothetical protein MKW94_011578, partial [Papaver nudicaule]|nr:hypothetical protein [Papaver nudicaule]